MAPYIMRRYIFRVDCVGVAEFRLSGKFFDMEIIFKTKSGHRPFPHIYRIATEKAKTYPSRILRGLKVRVIPIKDFEIIKYRRPSEVSSYTHRIPQMAEG